MKIYTKTGDGGETGLIDGSRVPKNHARVASYGDVDELNAVLGAARAQSSRAELRALLHEIQRDLFAIGAQLADPDSRVAARRPKAALTAGCVEHLEAAIDQHEQALPPLRVFILPGGSPLGSFLHLARTVCRRAERSAVTLSQKESIDPLILTYLNRLSDLLFVLARFENRSAGEPEDAW
jgi:cob(I)alamin adenosyltransferase